MTDFDLVAGLARHGGRAALILPDGSAVGFGRLAARALDFARRLGPGRRLVAIEASPSEHAIVAHLGCLAGGHVSAPLAPCEASGGAFLARFRPDAAFRRSDGRWRLADLAHEDAGPPPPPLHPDLALLLTTSGSTGEGKAVRLSRQAVLANARSIADYLGLDGRDRAALALPLHYSYGLSVLMSHLVAGAGVALAPVPIGDPGFGDFLRETRCTNLSAVPHGYALLEASRFRDRDLPDLRFMTVAGGRLGTDLVRRYDAHMRARGGRFFAMYGQTEATARIAFVPPERLAEKPDAIGVAIPGGALSLVDEAGREVEGAGARGELCYRGPNVMMGYAGGRADLARGAEHERLLTGDLAERDAEGCFRILGRKRRMSKIAGMRIGHDALEAALAKAGVEAAVVGDDRMLVAAFSSGQRPGEVRRLAARLAGVRPAHVEAVFRTALPRLASGKLDYRALAGLLDRAAERRGVPCVEDAFRESFLPRRVSGRDSFVSLGGDSLRHAELSLALERRLGRVPEGWERTSLDALAALAPSHGEAARGAGGGVPADLALRALAILLVVVQHATRWPMAAGSVTMVVLVGWSLARFGREALAAGDLARLLRPLPGVLGPYYLILAGYALAWGTVPWASVALLGNAGFADPAERTMLPFLYWFVEVFAQLTLLLLALFLVPAIRRAAGRDAFRLGLALLLGAVVLRFAAPPLMDLGGRRIFTLPWVAWAAALGWCAACAETRARKLLLVGLAALLLPAVAYDGGNWTGSWIRFGAQMPVLLLLLFVPRLPLPAPLRLPVLALAAAAFPIYLVHRFVPELLMAPVEASIPAGLFALLSVAGGVGLGLLVHAGQRRLTRRLARMRPPAPRRPGRRAGAAVG